MKTVIGLYDDLDDARLVVDALTDAGIRANYINVVAGDAESRIAGQLTEYEAYDEADAAVDGAVAGGVLGGLAGILAGLSAFVVPGLGPVVAAGPLISGIVGAGIGAASGGLIAALVEWGVSEEEAEFYLEGVRRGGVMVAVQAPEEHVDVVSDIMHSHGLIDLEERAAAWRAEGWSGYEPGPYEELDFDTYDNAFQEHWATHYEATAFPYANYTPAYRFGYFLAGEDRFMGHDWVDVEPEARRIWQKEYGEPWDDYREAIEYSWRRARMKDL